MRLIEPRAIIDQIVISFRRMSAAYAFPVVLPNHQLATAKTSAESARDDYASDRRLRSGRLQNDPRRRTSVAASPPIRSTTASRRAAADGCVISSRLGIAN
jgi:hypothetical protein